MVEFNRMDKLWVPEKNTMRPQARSPYPRDVGRMGLQYAQSNNMVMDLGAPRAEFPAQKIERASQAEGMQSGTTTTSPASARFTPGWVTPVEPKATVEVRIHLEPGIGRKH